MKLSTRARYALRAMLVIARDGKDDKPVNLATVAETTALSRRYLEQVAISLKNAGLLRAVPGKHGGHLLNKPAETIMLLDIVEAAIGPINIVDCVGTPDSCMVIESCECRGLYVLINEKIREVLNSFTLSDLAEEKVQAAVDEQLDEMMRQTEKL